MLCILDKVLALIPLPLVLTEPNSFSASDIREAAATAAAAASYDSSRPSARLL